MTTSSNSTNEAGGSIQLFSPEITPELIESMKTLIGIDLRIDHSIHNEVATRLAVTKFAAGIGDTNPLWTDPEYASKTRYGERIAPPSWVIAVFGVIQFGWEGLGAFHSASNLQFYEPIRLGDHISVTCRYDGFTGPRPSRFARQALVDQFTTRYVNQYGVLIAENQLEVTRFERGHVRPKHDSGQARTHPHTWESDALEAIEARVLAERPRGSEIRWWQDVQVGDRLDPILKGPIGVTDEVAYVVAGGTPIPRLAAHRAALLEYQRHPAWAFRDPETGALEPIYAVHYNSQAARAMGVETQYDVGFQRHCWQIHLLTDWMGDDGWVRQSASRYRSFVYLGDVIELSGTITEKFIDENGEACVSIETSALNQYGEQVMPGTAVIALPSRGNDVRPSDRRRSKWMQTKES
jgi:acyl dehydratase